ncbi:acyl-CoA carboxylase subunit epsilon [Actinoplanes regularis]|uniref:acyl-CoA carboxylase subunit epsilon n=1 Tax=Actinoplanes regularis TaxID=52697 RepID=UPI0024A183DA|nr:acyl-CoA carboxylase subunit epsilon [Actinoplanes regularis]GLW29342.1 hypothetical protein Areg01_22820 [Actinoplanes regularis]
MTITVARGNPSAEELAAVVVVLLSATANPAPGRPRAGTWAARHRLLRQPHTHGLAGWRTPSFPR